MNVIPFPNSKETVYLKQEELEKYNDLMNKLKDSIVPGEAIFYRDEIKSIIETARKRKK